MQCKFFGWNICWFKKFTEIFYMSTRNQIRCAPPHCSIRYSVVVRVFETVDVCNAARCCRHHHHQHHHRRRRFPLPFALVHVWSLPGGRKKEGLAVISSSHMWELYLPLNRLFASFISFACDKIAYVHGWKAISTDRRTDIRHGTNLKCTATKSSIFGWNSFATHSNLHTLPILTHTHPLYTLHTHT